MMKTNFKKLNLSTYRIYKVQKKGSKNKILKKYKKISYVLHNVMH